MGLMNEYIERRLSATDLQSELQKLISNYNKLRETFTMVYASAIGKPIPIPDLSLSQDDYYIIHDLINEVDSPKLDFYIETPGGSAEAKVRKKEVPTLFTFLNNESINREYIDRVPFMNIFCSLWASTIVHEQTRKYKYGDLLDVVALACAIPYCQIITTDNNMKNFVGRLGFDRKHGISVYAPTAKDLDAFAKALSDLVSR